MALSSLSTLAGSLVAVRVTPLKPGRMAQLVSGVAGFLLAAAFMDLIPYAAQETGARWLPFVFVGYLVVYAAESLFPAHLHPEGQARSSGAPHLHGGRPVPAAGGASSFYGAMAGLSVHAFFDGVALMGSFSAGLSSGLLVLVAVTIHKLPVGFGLGALGRGAGRPRSQAAWSGGVLSLASLAGAVAVLALGSRASAAEPALLPLAAGALIYIGATDMIPSTHQEAGRTQGIYALLGAIAFYLSLLLARSLGLD